MQYINNYSSFSGNNNSTLTVGNVPEFPPPVIVVTPSFGFLTQWNGTELTVTVQGGNSTNIVIDGQQFNTPVTHLPATTVDPRPDDGGWSIKIGDGSMFMNHFIIGDGSSGQITNPNLEYLNLVAITTSNALITAFNDNGVDAPSTAVPDLSLDTGLSVEIGDQTLTVGVDNVYYPWNDMVFDMMLNGNTITVSRAAFYNNNVGNVDEVWTATFDQKPFITFQPNSLSATNFINTVSAFNSANGTSNGNMKIVFDTTSLPFEFDGTSVTNQILIQPTTTTGAHEFTGIGTSTNSTKVITVQCEVLAPVTVNPLNATVNKMVVLSQPTTIPSGIQFQDYCYPNGTAVTQTHEFDYQQPEYCWKSDDNVISQLTQFTPPNPQSTITAEYDEATRTVTFNILRTGIDDSISPTITMNGISTTTGNIVIPGGLFDGTYDYVVEWPTDFWQVETTKSSLIVGSGNAGGERHMLAAAVTFGSLLFLGLIVIALVSNDDDNR